ncbi:YjzD family protein [Bacillus cihuensis]|uniref:YjzD family protein n=1 Tax=Bacillus cihuensis TaxID=1208599 RepID=UPI00041B5646|nr:YjzD family protein [Bacillus cihuensis]
MRYFMTFFWAFILMHMLTYVAGSMIGVAYNFTTASILGVVSTILILIVPAILPNDSVEKTSH